jgi:hypothetical protein
MHCQSSSGAASAPVSSRRVRLFAQANAAALHSCPVGIRPRWKNARVEARSTGRSQSPSLAQSAQHASAILHSSWLPLTPQATASLPLRAAASCAVASSQPAPASAPSSPSALLAFSAVQPQPTSSSLPTSCACCCSSWTRPPCSRCHAQAVPHPCSRRQGSTVGSAQQCCPSCTFTSAYFWAAEVAVRLNCRANQRSMRAARHRASKIDASA